MVDWRRNNQQHYQEAPSTSAARSQSKKPPPGSWQTVPSWEKNFCALVGSVPWRKLVEAKRMMSYYENIAQWNDSAGEEAFCNAKSRYWAAINGLPCDISLPDPDIYIDDIDWNSEIDPELLLDLDREPMAPDDRGRKGKFGFRGDNVLSSMNHPVPRTGWGDSEDDQIRTRNNLSSEPGSGDASRKEGNPWESNCSGSNRGGWGNAEEDPIRMSNNHRQEMNEDNPWESNHARPNLYTEDTRWGNGCEKSWGWNQWENKNKESDSFGSRRTRVGSGDWEGNWRKREGPSQYMSRYKTSRFQSDDPYQTGGGWKSGRGRKRVNFYERPTFDKKPFAQRPWNSVYQTGHHGAEADNLWRSWDKQVS